MRLKCSMALCYVMLLAVSVYSLRGNASSPLQKFGQAEVAISSQQWVGANDIENVPYIPIKEVARRQWCKERRHSSQAIIVSVSAEDVQSPVRHWFGGPPTAGLAVCSKADGTRSQAQVLQGFGRTLVLPPQ